MATILSRRAMTPFTSFFVPLIGISRLEFRFDAFGVVHLDWEPPTEGTGFALLFALDIDRQHVVQDQEFGELVAAMLYS